MPIGATFAGSFSFVSDTPDSLPELPNDGRYVNTILESSFRINNTALVDTGVASQISVLNGSEGYDDYYIHERSLAFREFDIRLSLVFSDYDQGVFVDDSLPLTPPPLDAFEVADWSMGTPNSDFTVLGNFTSLTLHMPEPSSVLLLAGVAVVLRRRC